MNPATPAITKAACQPQVNAMTGTSHGARIAPTFVPELKMLVANARSFLGNHSAMDLMARRKIPAFAQTKGNAGGKKPTDAANQSVAERRQAPCRNGNRVADLRTEAVDKPTEKKQPDPVGELEDRVDHAELFIRPTQLLIKNLLDKRENLPAI